MVIGTLALLLIFLCINFHVRAATLEGTRGESVKVEASVARLEAQLPDLRLLLPGLSVQRPDLSPLRPGLAQSP